MNINEIINIALEDIYLDYPSLAETINEKKQDYFISIINIKGNYYTIIDFQTPQEFNQDKFIYKSEKKFKEFCKYEKIYKHLKGIN